MISPEERERQMKWLRTEREARLPWDEVPGSWTQKEKTQYEIRGREIDAKFRLYPVFGQFVNIERELKEAEAHIDFELECKTKLMTDLRAIGDPQGGYALGRFQNLSMSIDYIDGSFNPDMGYSLATLELGKLFLAAGRGVHLPGEQFPRISWPGSLPTLQEKVKHLRAKLEYAQDLINQFEQIPVQEPVTP